MVQELFRSATQTEKGLGDEFKRELQQRIEEELNRH